MKLIAHRKNTIADLQATPTEYGIEVDIRSYGERLIIHHDPFVIGEDFNEWLKHYRHGTLILNVKEEGLEARLIELMKAKNISDYFFLDQSFPFLIKWARLGETNSAVRLSEFESIDTALTLAGKIKWVWVDYFSHFPLDKKSANHLQQEGFKLCLVSPELQNFDAATHIGALVTLLKQQDIMPDAVCTKQPQLWQELMDI
ncbi:MAG: hypothetical protein K0U45_06585 [Alphaproteobacteria bacterium]|nr:hypothetical protein [Alphaproteobacteria bacterium]